MTLKSRGSKKNSFVRFMLVGLAVLTAGAAKAEKMDAEIHTVVIEKLEQTLSSAKEDETVNFRPVRARLADLYSERARLRAMEEAEKGCSDCKGALEDRRRALRLYDVVLAEAPKENRGPLMLQMAQLNEVNLDNKKAEALYERIVAEGMKRHTKAVYAEGLLGRAEARFSKGHFEKSQDDFEAAMRIVTPGRRGLIWHRIAWCHLNKGEQPLAVRTLVKILETPELLMRDSTSGATFDASFQEDVARDLATFFARGNLTAREVARLESLAPDRARRDVMKHFANETERLGQKRAAIMAWDALVKYEEKSSDRLEAMVRVAQIRFDLGEKRESLRDMGEAVQYWIKKGCDDAELCEQLKQRLRGLVIVWNKQEKKNPSGLLVDAYLTYLAKFDDDVEMTQWAAEAARTQKRYAQAATLYYKSSNLVAARPNMKDAKNLLEAAVVGYVEMAELSKDNRTREQAYEHYARLNPNGAIINKIRYQHAHVAYERGAMKEASARFRAFALSSACVGNKSASDLCVKAADLDLDALVGIKDHVAVQARATEYARAYPSRRTEYLKIARTAVHKQAEQVEPAQALAKLNEADLTGATLEEKVRFHKTRMILAEKARDLVQARGAGASLLALKGISEDDRELAYGKIAWAAEMSLDFEEAYQITRRMKLSKMDRAERAMKLALLAELSGRSPRSHEEEFLRVSRDNFQKAFVRAKIVRSSGSSRVLAQHEGALKAYPGLYAALVLELYAKSGNPDLAEKALRVRGVTKEPAGRMLARQMFMREFSVRERKLARHQLNSSSEALMQRSLMDRLKLIGDTEKMANDAINSKDWTLQLLSLSALSRENKRVYSDILSLPIPRKLKGSQREAYKAQVDASARNYLAKHEQIEKKLTLLWGDHESQQALSREFKSSRPEIRPLLAHEIRSLVNVAPGGIRGELEDDLRSGSQIPSAEEVLVAQRKAKQEPFNAQTLAKLRELEVNRGRETMVAYLDARLLKLKAGEKR